MNQPAEKDDAHAGAGQPSLNSVASVETGIVSRTGYAAAGLLLVRSPMNTQCDENPQLSPSGCLCALPVACLLLLFAVALVATGKDAIQGQKWEFKWRGIKAIGPVGGVEVGISTYLGVEAIRCGIGLVAGGAMLGTWGIGLLLSTAGPHSVRALLHAVGNALAGVSLCLLVIACGSFFPPWRLWSLAFYCVVALVSWFMFLGLWSGTPSRWCNVAFPSLLGAAIVVGFIRPDVAVAIVLGLFAGFGGWVHLATLVPAVRQRFELVASTNPPRRS